MKTNLFSFILTLKFSFSICLINHKIINIEVSDAYISKLEHFWRSTGLCPPQPHQEIDKFLLSNDMKQNFLLISSTPHKGLQQIRIHWLLDLIKWNQTSNSYNFEALDQLVELFYKNHLTLGFEVMGNPSEQFTNFENTKDIKQLKTLVQMIASRYIKRFGASFVRKWNFESWNEPDHKDFDHLNISIHGFLNYFSAVSMSLKNVDDKLTFGGPAGSCRKESFSKICWTLLHRCAVEGPKKCGLDFISIHKKGNSDAETILRNEVETIKKIHQFPQLTKVPIINDEADPLVGWNRAFWWRTDSTYAAIIAKVICMHQYHFNINSDTVYKLLSNDNAFLSYHPHFFSQRTLNSRFQMNNSNPAYSHLIRKPALTVMSFLSKLGDQQIDLKVTTNNQSTIGGMASIRGSSCNNLEVSTILYNSANTEIRTSNDEIKIKYQLKSIIKNLAIYSNCSNRISMMVCRIDNHLTNPYKIWTQMKRPVFPSSKQFQQLHLAEGPYCSKPKLISFNSRDKFQDHLFLRLPGVLLQQICWDTGSNLQGPTNLQIFPITLNQILIKWNDDLIETRCIKSYVIEKSTNEDDFLRITHQQIIFNSFYFISSSLNGTYRVFMEDFFGRKSPYSNIVDYSK